MESKNKRWLYCGIITGFLSGFIYFALGVYMHSPHNPNVNLKSEGDSYKYGKTR